jgi:glycosyltransferase involved in cell wall biosynthesis
VSLHSPRPAAGRLAGLDCTVTDQAASPLSLDDAVRRARTAGIERVLMLAYRDLDDPAAGGSELHAHHVLRRWVGAGLRIEQRTVEAPGRPAGAQRDGYRVERRGGRRLGVPRITAEAVTRRLPATDAVVEVWNGFPFWTPLWWRGPRLVLLHHLHDELWKAFFPSPADRVGSLIERRVAPWAYRRSPVATLAPSSRDELLRRTSLRPSLVHVVPPGIDPAFTPGGQRSGHPSVVAVGRLTSAKRFDHLIRAVAALVDEIEDLELVIVGEGPERQPLQQLVDALGLSDVVRLVGRVNDDELVELYRRSWVAAAASVSEGWGMTLTEAAACGTPAVASDIVGHRDAVPEGTGLLAASELGLEAALRKLLRDHDLRARLGDGALARARRLTWDTTAAHLLALLVDDAARRRR